MKWYLVNRSCSTTRSIVTYQSASHPLREPDEAGNEGHRLVLQIWTPLCASIAVNSASSTQTSHRPYYRNTSCTPKHLFNFPFCEHQNSCCNRTGNWRMNDIFEKNLFQPVVYVDAPSEDKHVLFFLFTWFVLASTRTQGKAFHFVKEKMWIKKFC